MLLQDTLLSTSQQLTFKHTTLKTQLPCTQELMPKARCPRLCMGRVLLLQPEVLQQRPTTGSTTMPTRQLRLRPRSKLRPPSKPKSALCSTPRLGQVVSMERRLLTRQAWPMPSSTQEPTRTRPRRTPMGPLQRALLTGPEPPTWICMAKCRCKVWTLHRMLPMVNTPLMIRTWAKPTVQLLHQVQVIRHPKLELLVPWDCMTPKLPYCLHSKDFTASQLQILIGLQLVVGQQPPISIPTELRLPNNGASSWLQANGGHRQLQPTCTTRKLTLTLAANSRKCRDNCFNSTAIMAV
mmetsp:Transcript_34502/g.43569  ORF Transcript_34502/g.43569 Transcript_34502/m.43569 type:complete len:295 (-) Transcript_34502:795-1679(-)